MDSHRQVFPPQTLEQSRVYHPNPLIHSDVPPTGALVAQPIQHVEERESRIVDNYYSSQLFPTALQPDINDAMDADIAARIAERAFEDLRELLTGQKGKPSKQDYLYANVWLAALMTDAAYLEALTPAEEAAVHSRLVAGVLSRGGESASQPMAQHRVENSPFSMRPDLAVTADTLSPAAKRYGKQPSGKSADLSRNPFSTQELHPTFSRAPYEEYTAWNNNVLALTNIRKRKFEIDDLSLAPGPSVDRNKWVQCIACCDSLKYKDALQTPCDHNYCTSCVIFLVEKFTQDETYFPLRCCEKPIPINDIIPLISSALYTTFLQKHAEFSVPAKDRIYCAKPACSTFLGSSEGIGWTAIVCPKCKCATCVRCKQAAHIGEDCVVHASTVQLRMLAQREGWQMCPGCRVVVERTTGCREMRCRCGTQFCYQCGARWKNYHTCVKRRRRP